MTSLGSQVLGENVEKEDVDRVMGNGKLKLSGLGEGQRSVLGQTLVRIFQMTPTLLASLGLIVLTLPVLTETIYQNYYLGAGTFILFFVWVLANYQKGYFSKTHKDWLQKRKVLIGMSLCMTLGIVSLSYYEMKMPKYEVALIKKELYRVPSHLSRKQLLEMGADCNTYGNTLCSHDVFAKIVKMDSRDYNSLANLAMAQSHLGFHKEALVNFQRALKNGIATYDIYKFYGHSLLALGHRELARNAYQQSLNLNPKQQVLRDKIEELQFAIN